MKKAFTLVELMLVVAIIAILLTIVFSSVKGAFVAARQRRAEALCQTVQSGLATYHAQKDEWPEPLGGKVQSGSFTTSNGEGINGQADPDKYVLTASEVRAMVKALVDEAKKGNPMLDVSALYVSRDSGEHGQKGYGMDFMTAVHGSRESRRKMSSSEMYFGYPDPDTARFRRFKMVYSIPTDSLSVQMQ